MSNKYLDGRKYKVKKPKLRFFCPLCRTERGLKYRSRLNKVQYFQVAIISTLIMMATFNFMLEKIFIWPFMVWGIMEFVNKTLYRKELPCPHCGFDATWYKRDVKKASQLVTKFWDEKGVQTPLSLKLNAENLNTDSQQELEQETINHLQ